MSNEKETPEAIEAAKRYEESVERINRARDEALAVPIIQTPRERAIAEFEAEAADLEKEPNPLDINANVARPRTAPRKQKSETVQ